MMSEFEDVPWDREKVIRIMHTEGELVEFMQEQPLSTPQVELHPSPET